jgi:hypothetical protein
MSRRRVPGQGATHREDLMKLRLAEAKAALRAGIDAIFQ